MTGWNERARDDQQSRGPAHPRPASGCATAAEPDRQRRARCPAPMPEPRSARLSGKALDQQIPAAEVRREQPLEKVPALLHARLRRGPRHVHLRSRRRRRKRRAAASRRAASTVGRERGRGRATAVLDRRDRGRRAISAASLRRHRSISASPSVRLAAGRRTTILPPAMPTMRSAKALRQLDVVHVDDAPGCRARAPMSVSSCMISTEVFGSSDEVGSSASSSRRLLHHRARDADALPLSAGERIGALIGEITASPTTSSSSNARAMSARRKLAPPRAPRRHVAQAARTAGSPSP